MKTLCGIDCSNCSIKYNCGGCVATNGHPFHNECVTAECYKAGGEECFITYKNRLIEEFNALGIANMPKITTLCSLNGSFVNLEYSLPNRKKIKLLEDSKIYLGYQVEKTGSDRCYGLVADNEHLLVCEYGADGADPEIVVYKKRKDNL